VLRPNVPCCRRPDLGPKEEASMRVLLFAALAAAANAAEAAKPDWQSLGETVNGNQVSLDVANKRASGGIWSVTFRTVLKTPLETAGGAITTMKSRMRVKCADQTAAGVEVTLYEDEASNKVFARNRAAAIEYRKEPAGSSADLVVKAVCRK
jgi:hypothetical protein